MNNDLISRQAAIDAIRKGYPDAINSDYKDGLRIATDRAIYHVEQLPLVTPEQQWIPWNSGNLPEESGTYAVTAYDGATKRVTYAKYQKRLKRWELTGARAYWRVLAWMEKPKPWEGGQDGKN